MTLILLWVGVSIIMEVELTFSYALKFSLYLGLKHFRVKFLSNTLSPGLNLGSGLNFNLSFLALCSLISFS